MYDEENPDENLPILPEVRIYWLVIAIFVAVGVLNLCLARMGNDRWIYIQTVVLIITLVVVAWNAFLVRKTQQAMVAQTNVSIMPIIEIHLILRGSTVPFDRGRIEVRKTYLELENIGNGTALNVTIDDVLVMGSGHTRYWFIGGGDPTWFGTLSSLTSQQKRQIEDIQLFDREKIKSSLSRPDILKHLDPRTATDDTTLVIRFSDILGNKYAQTYTLGKSGTITGTIQKSKDVRKRTIKF